MPSHCYILYSKKLNKYYVGPTSDLERRLNDHNRGKEKFTRTGMPWELVYAEPFEKLAVARRRELEIKKKKSRKFIESLISSVG
jgi:putative endonuclease